MKGVTGTRQYVQERITEGITLVSMCRKVCKGYDSR